MLETQEAAHGFSFQKIVITMLGLSMHGAEIDISVSITKVSVMKLNDRIKNYWISTDGILKKGAKLINPIQSDTD